MLSLATLAIPAYSSDLIPSNVCDVCDVTVAPGAFVDTPDSYGVHAIASTRPLYTVHTTTDCDYFTYSLADALRYGSTVNNPGFALHLLHPPAPSNHPNHPDNIVTVITFLVT